MDFFLHAALISACPVNGAMDLRVCVLLQPKRNMRRFLARTFIGCLIGTLKIDLINFRKWDACRDTILHQIRRGSGLTMLLCVLSSL